MTQRQAELIELLHKEVKPALGCTEPIAVALAVAKATEVIADVAKSNRQELCNNIAINVAVSGNILKNGMGVGIPGTGMVGLYIASALGAACGKSEYGLEVLKDINDEVLALAKKLTSEEKVKIGLADTTKKLYIKACVKAAGHHSEAIIEDDHDNIVSVKLDGEVLHSSDSNKDNSTDEEVHSKSTLDYHLTVKDIFDFANEVDTKDIAFILESRDVNLALSKEGLRGNYGLMVGKTIISRSNTEIFGEDFMSYAMGMTAAASDARMAGCTLPAMSNSGSGNQGITVTMPIIAYSLKHNISDEVLSRALVLSHLIAIHIKGYLGKLSALCGCVVASTGSSCGVTYLKGGNYDQICSCIKNMIGSITGMVCDGAKVGCAMKVASGVSCAVQSSALALDGICISSNDGIIEDDIEKTIRNLGKIGSDGMLGADKMILDIMTCK